MARIFTVLWLSLLLIGLQQQLVVHQIEHLQAKLRHGQGLAIEKANTGACLECELLASGANSAASFGESAGFIAPGAHAVAASLHAFRSVSFAAYYQSRAPPALV